VRACLFVHLLILPRNLHVTFYLPFGRVEHSRPSNASRQRAARYIFLFTRPMVGDARDRRRDMSARRTAAAGGGSCHRDVGTLWPGDRTSRGRRALIVSNGPSLLFIFLFALRRADPAEALPRCFVARPAQGLRRSLHRAGTLDT